MLQNKIRSVRKAAKITQGELAEKLGINRATISKYETGEISLSIEMLQKIADALHADWRELVPESEQAEMTVEYPKLSVSNDTKPTIVTRIVDPDQQIRREMAEYNIRRTYDHLNIDGRLKAGEYLLSFLFTHFAYDGAEYELNKIMEHLSTLSSIPQYQQYSNEPKPKEEGDNG